MRQTFEEAADRSFAARHLPRLRAELEKQGLDGFVVPHEDEHQNEYLPAANERLAWVSGFTGSAGAAVVMKDHAAIFTDGRYTVQVRDQVDPAFFEYLDLVEGGPPAFIASQAAGAVIGYDPRLHSPTALGHIERAAERAGAVLKAVDVNPIDLAWGDEYSRRRCHPHAPAAGPGGGRQGRPGASVPRPG
jgi:Xaa-Pro aminopeptidase